EAPSKRGSSALRTDPPLPIKDWHLWGVGGSGYPNLTGTRSHFCWDRLGNRKRKLSSFPPSPKSCGTRDRSQKTMGPFRKRSTTPACAVGTWLCCEAASCHSRVPTLKLTAPGIQDGR
ncbi:unnamed protein product, partial [Staurois parvus]